MENTELKEESKNEVLFEIKRSETEVIRVSKRAYKGTSYVDLRIFFKPDGAEDFRPTRKGLTVKEPLFLELVCGVSEVLSK